jgi:ATP-dependent helicase/nuclease subunit A
MTSDTLTRTRALDPARSFIVQAPAGSGKTELLTQRYLRLLANVEQPEQILAITFTRKAAAEMRNRILLALESAAGAAPDSQHKRTTWELARAVRSADAQRHWQLLEHPSRLRIQTIDALNSTLARRLPILAGTGSALEPTDDPRPLYELAAQRLIERLGDDSAESASLELLIVHLGNRVDRLVDLLRDLLAKRDQWLHQIVSAGAHDDLRAALERTLQGMIDRHLAQLCDHLLEDRRRELWALTIYAAENMLRDPTLVDARRLTLQAHTRYVQAPGAQSDHLDAWLAIIEVFFRDNGQLYKSVNIKRGFPKTDIETKTRMQEVLAQLAEEENLCKQLAALRHLPRPVYSDEQWLILQALLDVLPLAVAELQLVFQSRGQADYIEGALRALQALGTSDEPTDLALAFDYRLQHLLVDEFQDTSFAQLDLLERLTAGWVDGDGRTMFCVGDPMQSIYRFRQAEVGLFLQLQQQGLRTVRLEPLTLTANFRSTRPIIEWVNRVFPAVLSAENDPEQGAVKYSASVAAVTSRAGGVHIHPSLDADALAEARRVVMIARDALKRDPNGTIAVLVTARAHVGMIATELHAASIEFQAVEIEQLLDRPVVQDLIALTRALVHLADRTAWLATLRAPWCGLTLVDLHVLVDGDRSSTLNALLTKNMDSSALTPDGRARIERVYPILRAALDERGRWPLREWVERTWNALGGPATLDRTQDLDDADAYFRRLDQIEIAGDLEDVALLEQQLDRLFARPQAEGRARVEVMTIHKAKGLEFDTVILPALHRWMRGEDRELLRWTRIAGHGGGIVFAPIKAEGRDPDPMYRWIELLERERSTRERARLLYVAATRAKRDLHLLGTVQAKDDEEGLRLIEPRNGSMLRMLWHEVRASFEKRAHTPATRTMNYEAVPTAWRLRQMPLTWQAPQADTAVRVRVPAILDAELPQPDFDWVTETSRHVGTLVHRELERMVRDIARSQSTGADASAALRAAQPRLIAELIELGVPPDRCETATGRVLAAIERTLADERGQWLLGLRGDIEDAQSELALSGVLDDQVVVAVIDRTFVDSHGTRWIVDFKTSTHEGSGLEAFLEAEVERYWPQLRRYARLMGLLDPGRPVRAALYFPLLGQWREIPFDNMTEVSKRAGGRW